MGREMIGKAKDVGERVCKMGFCLGKEGRSVWTDCFNEYIS